MANIYFVPTWFFGYDIALELIFAIITLTVSLTAYKLYKLSEQREPKILSISFMFISISYFIQSIVNFLIISKLNQNICNALKITSLSTFNDIGLITHIIFFTLGLITLAYLTLKIESTKTYLLLILMNFIILAFSKNLLYTFYLISSMLLIYITIYYFINYLKIKKIKNLLITITFLLLLIGHAHFLFPLNHGLFYVIRHITELIAYLSILTSILLTYKK